MTETDAIRIAMDFARYNGLKERIERVSFVDAGGLAERLKSKGSFWVAVFKSPEHPDVVIEHSGVVLNIGDSDKSVTVVG